MVSHWVVGGQFPKTRLSERPLLAVSSRSRTSGHDPKQTFPDCLKRDPDHLIPNHGIAGLAVEFIALRASKVTVGLVASAGEAA